MKMITMAPQLHSCFTSIYKLVIIHDNMKLNQGPLSFLLRLDNTGAWEMEVYPSLLCGLMSESVGLYIKLKLGIFSFI